jgi:hypothetical protein
MSGYLSSSFRLDACIGANCRHQVSGMQLGTGLVPSCPGLYQVRTKSVPSRYQVVSSQGGTKWGPSRDQVIVRTPQLEAESFERVVVSDSKQTPKEPPEGGMA